MKSLPVVLTIAGSDSSGGAGVQADLKTLAALGCYGASVITAVTAQHTGKISAIYPLSGAAVAAQITTVCAELEPAVVKIGMLYNQAIIRAVSRSLKELALKKIILDPLVLSSSQRSLLSPNSAQILQEALFSRCDVLTPNLAEAEKFSNVKINSPGRTQRAAEILHALMRPGSLKKYVIIKGGHRNDRGSADLLYDGEKFTWFHGRRIPGRDVHGTGCTFASALAAFWTANDDMIEAVRRAKDYVHGAIEHSIAVTRGRYLIDHFYRWRK